MIFFDSLSREAASSWLNVSEDGVLVASALLAIGLIGEFSEKPDWRKRIWYVLAKVAVVIGVVGELLSDGALYASSHRLQAIQELELTVAYIRAADAEHDLIQILSPRDLTPPAQKRVVEKVKPLGPMPFDFALTVSMEEKSEFMRQLPLLLIRDCGWKLQPVAPGVARYGNTIFGVTLGSGVVIAYDEANPEFKEAAEILATALGNEGIAARAESFKPDKSNTKNVIHIAIGTKPLITGRFHHE